MAQLNTKQSAQIVNGIDVDALSAVAAGVRENPELGATHWKVTSDWAGQTRSEAKVQSCSIGGQNIKRRFSMLVDEPLELGGTNEAANPQEYLLAGLNGCMVVGYAAVCALKGIELRSLQIVTQGDIDLRGFLGISDTVAAGYESLDVTVKIDADATPAQLQEVHDIVMKTSPNFYNITRAVKVNGNLEIV